MFYSLLFALGRAEAILLFIKPFFLHFWVARADTLKCGLQFYLFILFFGKQQAMYNMPRALHHQLFLQFKEKLGELDNMFQTIFCNAVWFTAGVSTPQSEGQIRPSGGYYLALGTWRGSLTVPAHRNPLTGDQYSETLIPGPLFECP